MRRRPERRKKH
jgi:hypothetical protein